MSDPQLSHDPLPPIGPSVDAGLQRSRRLPPIALPFLIVGATRSLLAVWLFLFISQGVNLFTASIAVLGLLPTFISSIAKYWAFSYELDPEELIIHDGIFTRKVRNVPYSRIQNVDLVQNLFHRWLKVAVVRLETASGGKPEAVIRVLTLPAVEELRAHILHGQSSKGSSCLSEASTIDSEPQGRELLSVEPARLALLGLLSNRGMLVVAAAAGLAQQAGVFENPAIYEPLMKAFPEVDWNGLWQSILSHPVLTTLGFLLLVTALWGLTRLLSALWVMVNLYGFNLRRDDEDLRTEYGLLTRVTATVPRHRIQLLSIKESFLQLRWGLASVQIETAGGGGNEDSNAQGPGAARLWLAPMIERIGLAGLMRDAVPQTGLRGDLDQLDWQPLAPNARRRLLRRSVLLVLVPTAIALWPLGPWALAFALLLPLLFWRAYRFVARAGWALSDQAVYFRSGAFGLQTSMVPFAKIQGLRIVQSPFDRRNRMASVRVDTAGASPTGHRVEIPFLETGTAHRLVERLEHQAAELEFHW